MVCGRSFGPLPVYLSRLQSYCLISAVFISINCSWFDGKFIFRTGWRHCAVVFSAPHWVLFKSLSICYCYEVSRVITQNVSHPGVTKLLTCTDFEKISTLTPFDSCHIYSTQSESVTDRSWCCLCYIAEPGWKFSLVKRNVQQLNLVSPVEFATTGITH